MSARTAFPTLWMASALLLVCALPAGAGPWNLSPGEYYTELRGGFFSSETYHDQNGDRQFLYGLGKHEERSVTSYTEFGWKKKVSFILGAQWLGVTRLPETTTSYPTETGLGDALIGLRYGLVQGRSAAALEVDWKAPLGYERTRVIEPADTLGYGSGGQDENWLEQVGSPLLGDGQQDVTGSLLLGTSITSRGFGQISAGYKYRFETPENQFVGGADLAFWLTPTLLVAGRYRGQMALTEGDRPTVEPDRHLVGPTILYRVDDHLDIFALSLHTAAAKNALHTDEVFVGVAFKQTKLHRLQGFLGGSSAP